MWGVIVAEWLGVLDRADNEIISYYAGCVSFVGTLLLMQWLFLRPRRHWVIQLRKHARPMKSSVVAAAFMGMLLTAALVITLLEIPDWWKGISRFDKKPGWRM